MTQSNNNSSDPIQQIEWLTAQLQDAHLVVGRQQMQLLQMQRVIEQLQAQVARFEQQFELKAEQEAPAEVND